MNNDAEQAETGRCIEILRQQTVARLRAAAGEWEAIAVAIRQFLDQGMQIVYSPSALWDHFAISHPDLPTQAGYDKPERERIIRIFGTVSWEKFGGGRPPPADYPHETFPELAVRAWRQATAKTHESVAEPGAAAEPGRDVGLSR